MLKKTKIAEILEISRVSAFSSYGKECLFLQRNAVERKRERQPLTGFAEKRCYIS